MTWVRYTLPAAAIMSIASPAYAMQYLSIDEAQKQAFPSATRFTEVQAGRVWKAEAGGRVAGFFIFDRVVGKHLYIGSPMAAKSGARAGSRSSLERPAVVRSRSTLISEISPARPCRRPMSPRV